MSLTLLRRRSPFNGDFARLREEMERTFDQFIGEPLGTPAEPKLLRNQGWIPALDVSETDTELTIRAEVPGVAVKDLEISVIDGALTITGRKESQEEKKGENFYRCERTFGTFKRVIDLPETADFDKINAEAENGLITIRVAKKPSAKPKHIEIKPVNKKVAITG